MSENVTFVSIRLGSKNSPHAEFFAKHLDAVEVRHCAVHGVLVTHLHQRRARDALHELHLRTRSQKHVRR